MDSQSERVRIYNGQGAGATQDEAPTAIAVDQSGNTYVTGHSVIKPDQDSDFLTLKYDAAGSLLWKRTYNGPATRDKPRAMAIDGSGNVIVAGGVRQFRG